MSDATTLSLPAAAMLDALAASGPSGLSGPDADLYAPVIGSWDVDVEDHLPDGTSRRSRGEWHFAPVLEGRAIEDVFIVPPRGERAGVSATAGNRYGATLRMYDPRLAAWHVIWANPVTGALNRLLARGEAGRIVQLGRDGDKEIRWTFFDVAPDSFRWSGESSLDGQTWRLEVEFHARRRASAEDRR